MVRTLAARLLLGVILFAAAAGADDLKVPDAEQLVGRPEGTPVSGAQLDLRASEIWIKLRCPVCQGLSIADSPSLMAGNMKQQVRELLARGYTEPQILGYFERSYGQFVLLEPKAAGVNWIVWLAPLIGLIVGAGIVALAARKLRRQHLVRAAAFVEGNFPSEVPGPPPRGGRGGRPTPGGGPTSGGVPASGGSELEEDPYLARARELVYRAPEDETKR